jgi:hypothetical protein
VDSQTAEADSADFEAVVDSREAAAFTAVSMAAKVEEAFKVAAADVRAAAAAGNQSCGTHLEIALTTLTT